jgi:hypothetical protein
MKRWLYAAALLATPVFGQQTQMPDPRLEPHLGRLVIADIHRSVMLERTMPPAPSRPKPVVNEQDMARVGEHVFIERSLLPPSVVADDPSAVRIFRRDR